MIYGLIADLVVALHVAYVAFVIVGQLAILAGMVLGWKWIRNFWFRIAHVTAIAIVAFEAICGIECPLTVWERGLRALAGQPVSDATFVGRLLHSMLFYQAPSEVFTASYVGFALLVIGTFVLAPPRWPGKATPSGEADLAAGLR